MSDEQKPGSPDMGFYVLPLGPIGKKGVSTLGPEARQALDKAVRSVIHTIFRVMDGSCARYESNIKQAMELCHKDMLKRMEERTKELES